MTNQDLNRHFAELVELCWHEVLAQDAYTTVCSCGKKIPFGQSICRNPDFISDPWLVLREMAKKEEWPDFCWEINRRRNHQNYLNLEQVLTVDIDYVLDTTGLLVKAAIEFMEEEEGK